MSRRSSQGILWHGQFPSNAEIEEPQAILSWNVAYCLLVICSSLVGCQTVDGSLIPTNFPDSPQNASVSLQANGWSRQFQVTNSEIHLTLGPPDGAILRDCNLRTESGQVTLSNVLVVPLYYWFLNGELTEPLLNYTDQGIQKQRQVIFSNAPLSGDGDMTEGKTAHYLVYSLAAQHIRFPSLLTDVDLWLSPGWNIVVDVPQIILGTNVRASAYMDRDIQVLNAPDTGWAPLIQVLPCY